MSEQYKKITLLDGGMGRQLEKIGAPFSQPLWSAEALIKSPDLVAKVHNQFIDAGADIITVNSYACVPFHLGEDLFQEQGFTLAKKAAEIAKECARCSQKKVMVAGSIPPPFGSYRPDLFKAERAIEIYKTLIDAQKDSVDMWIVETMSSFAEFEVVSKLLKDSDKPVFYSFSLKDDYDQKPQLRSTELLEDIINKLVLSNVETILFNCSIPEVMQKALILTKNIFAEKNKPAQLGVYANNFKVIKEKGYQANETLQQIRELTLDDYLDFVKLWQRYGAKFIGGCCGIGPEYIEHINKWRKN